ncbi:hypothetical protein B0H11DRAFT_1402925 [Mycena galericulata]|nr:hypothetical protein B0H11DRAFT_1402925 [Mycena galericulata]
MAPSAKVLCTCCNEKISRRREREHRRALTSAPYASPPGIFPSRQRRVFGPSSEPDYELESMEAGTSGTRSPDSSSGPASVEDDSELEDSVGLDVDADHDFLPSSVDEVDFEGLEDLGMAGTVLPGGDSDDDDSEFYTGASGSFYGDQDDRESESVRDEDSDGENSDDDADLLDWDRFEAPGLSAWDQLGESYEAEAAAIANKLSQYDLAICRAFAYKVKSHTTDKAFKMIPHAFPQTPPLPKLDALRSRINFLAGFKPEIYDCCTNSCLCYVGPHKDLDRCTYCDEPRWRANGKPRKKFTYIPLIPRLVAFAANRDLAEKHKYRALRRRYHRCFRRFPLSHSPGEVGGNKWKELRP